MENFTKLLFEIHISTHLELSEHSVKSVITEVPTLFCLNDVPYAVISFCENRTWSTKDIFFLPFHL